MILRPLARLFLWLLAAIVAAGPHAKVVLYNLKEALCGMKFNRTMRTTGA